MKGRKRNKSTSEKTIIINETDCCVQVLYLLGVTRVIGMLCVDKTSYIGGGGVYDLGYCECHRHDFKV